MRIEIIGGLRKKLGEEIVFGGETRVEDNLQKWNELQSCQVELRERGQIQGDRLHDE